MFLVFSTYVINYTYILIFQLYRCLIYTPGIYLI